MCRYTKNDCADQIRRDVNDPGNMSELQIQPVYLDMPGIPTVVSKHLSQHVRNRSDAPAFYPVAAPFTRGSDSVFCALPTDPQKPNLVFKHQYWRFQEDFRSATGWVPFYHCIETTSTF